jgi:hypothetical protein
MNILQRKYPFQNDHSWLKDALLFSLIVFLLLFVLQPFGISSYTGNKFLFTLKFALITFVSFALFALLVFRPLQRRLKPWRIWHQALAILSLTLFIGFCNFLCIVPQVNGRSNLLPVFLLFLYWTLIVGSIVTAIAVGISYTRYLHRRLELLLDKKPEQQQHLWVTFHDTSVRGKDVQMPLNDFLYAEAKKNNVMLCYEHDGKVETQEIRSTLSALLAELNYENIIQCHRSFVVNINNITSAQGNSNGYQLKLGHCPHHVPVSRTYVPKLRSFIG